MSKPETDEVQIRRAPRYPAFIVAGALVGAIVTFVVTKQFPVDPTVGFLPIFGYFCLYGVTAGVVLGALVAIILDRVSARRAKTVEVEREIVPPLEEELER